MKRIMVAAAAALSLGCAPQPGEGQPSSGPGDEPPPAPTVAELAGATFTGVDDAGPVTLDAGRWEGKPFTEGGASVPTVWLTEDFSLTGDLDGDGRDEAVAHLIYNTGGTGSFGFLVVMGRDGDAIVQRAIGALGDRVQIRDARIEDASVILEVLQAGPEDGMCCPTRLATRTFAVRGGRLLETGTEVTGRASLETLGGTEWVLRELASGEDAPAQPELTLVIESGQVAGSSGCNTYRGTVESGETATGLAIGPLMSTRRACPPEVMTLEQRYTTALQSANAWAFRFRRLSISYGEGERFGSLLFEARAATAR